MEKQVIISISREYGSEGHLIAEKIAKDLGIPLYDRALLDALVEEKGIKVETLEKYDEKPRRIMLSRSVKGHSNSLEEIVAFMQFEYLQKKAASGESFVVVGRCAETVLKDYNGLIPIFVMGDKAEKIAHVKEKYHLSDKAAWKKMKRHDKERKAYHNRHSEHKWRDAKGYDICINSSKIGLEKTVHILEGYIRERISEKKEVQEA